MTKDISMRELAEDVDFNYGRACAEGHYYEGNIVEWFAVLIDVDDNEVCRISGCEDREEAQVVANTLLKAYNHGLADDRYL